MRLRYGLLGTLAGILCWAVLATPVVSTAPAPLEAFANFEGALTAPIRISPDGTRLFAVNTANSRLSVFDLSQPRQPSLIAEIPVGLEPVSVNPRTSDEAWVVNQLSDSISVVSVSRGMVVQTIRAGDEPADVVFAGVNRAFVTASRDNRVLVINTVTRTHIGSIPVFGGNPRALAVSADRTRVYAAFALSGNRTTIVPGFKAPPPPAPTNTALPPAPKEGVIVDAADPAWSRVIRYTMPDNDVVEIDAATLTV
jgi:YVTN family beta-propeller protein